MRKKQIYLFIILFQATGVFGQSHKTWETIELQFSSEKQFQNPYTDVEVWVQLKGPGFDKKVWGFWDGGNTFKVRVTATNAGKWSWESFSKPLDAGLNGKKGSFIAESWSEEEITNNPNRRGIIRTNPKAPHSFMYADGTPFFLFADTWWAAMTWRYPFKGGEVIPEDYVPEEENFSFEGGIQWLKRHGYNSIGIIASFPNWKLDEEGPVVKDDNGVFVRKGEAWEKPPAGKQIKDMHDEDGNMPFFFPGKCAGKPNMCANYDSINPLYWKRMDKKIEYLSNNGFIPYLETIRRDHLPAWIRYHDFNESFARYLNYLKARYGTYNLIFSLVHWDWFIDGARTDDLKGAFSYYHLKYGSMPFDQPVTAMVVESTSKYLGHIDVAPYLTCMSAGNTNRGHGILTQIEEFYHLEPQVPGFNNEPYYPLHDVPWGRAGGEDVEPDSERDNYFGRTHMYSNFFSGALAGHVFGTGAFGGSTIGEEPYVEDSQPAPWPKIWEALNIESLKQGEYFKSFVDELGTSYVDMVVAYKDLSIPRVETDVLDEWSYMLQSPDKKIILLYFEKKAKRETITKLKPGAVYIAKWFNPRTGEWIPMSKKELKVDENGDLELPKFPSGKAISENDWAAKLVLSE